MSDATQHPWPAGTRRLRVHDVLIDLRYRRVICPDREAELPQRMFDLLLVFLAEPQVLHSRAELFARVWPGVIVEDANLSQSVWMLRKALGEARKHWIRTVAKSGYVFEPPGGVEPVDDAGAVANAPIAAAPITNESTYDAPGPVSATAAGATPSRPVSARAPAGKRHWLRWLAAGLLVIAVIGGIPWWLHQRAEPMQPATTAPPLAIALIEVEDQAAPEDARWPATLLHAWLGWKLESLPEVTLLTEAHLAADSQGSSPRIVFLSSGSDAGDPNRVFLRARFDEGGREQRLEQEGTRAQLPAMADALSQQLLARLVPARADSRWPRLTLDTATARRYSEGVDALERRDWVASTEILREVADRAPDFGLARLQLGKALTRLSHAAPAIEHTEAAIRLLQPVPKEVAAVLRAELLARDPQRAEEAALAFAALASRYPGNTAYALDQARMLRRAGKFKEAIAILDQPHWSTRTVGNRLDQRLNLASAYLSMGDAVRAREQALAAERIARAAGKGWEQDLGDALLLSAQIDSFQYEEKADLSRYEEAARQFELAGDEMDALIARFIAESMKPDGTSQGIDTLLMQARERGYRRLEIQILRVVAFRHYSEGDMPAYRARLEQALATALAAGDVQEQHLLELDLLNEDFLRGRFDDADRRLASLRQAKLQGDSAIWVAQYDALVAANRGLFALAEATLKEADAEAQGANPGAASTAATRISCLMADLRLVQGDIAQARAEWKNCASSGQPSSLQQAQLGNAGVDLLAGDHAAALRQLREIIKPVTESQDGPDRWLTELAIATQLTRAGDPAAAQRLYERVLPLARRSDYDWIVAIAEVGLAETAATRGDWAAARRHLAAARAERVSDVWTLSNRLDVLDAAASIAAGDGARAMQLLSAVHEQAQRNRDAVTQMEVHSLLPPGAAIGECNDRCQSALVARTGLRGANLHWLTGPSKLDTVVLREQGIR